MVETPRVLATAVCVAVLCGLVIGCGSTGSPAVQAPSRASTSAISPQGAPPRRLPEPLPPAAEPANSPPTTVAPTGQIIPVGAAAEGIVADPITHTVIVGVRNPSALALLDADSLKLTGRVVLPGVLRHLQLAAPGGPVLVPDESSNSLIQVGLPGGTILSQLPTGVSPHDANRAANGTVFVANEGGGSVVVVRDNQVVHTFTDVTQPAGVASVGNTVGVIDVRQNTLTLYDAESLSGIVALPAGDGPTHVVADRHGRMIVADTRGGAILVYQITPQPRKVARVALPGQPYGIAYDPVRDQFWVTVTGANQLVGFDMTQPTPREIARIPTVRQPNTVAVEPRSGRLFVTGTAEGIVQAVSR